MKNDKKCPICNKEAEVQGKHPLNIIIACICDRCGSFQITEDAINSHNERELFKISAYLRERAIANQPPVTIVTSINNVRVINGPLVGIDDILAVFPKTVSERFDRILMNLYRLTPYPGAGIPIKGEKDYPVFFAENEEAYVFLRSALQDEGLIEFGGGTVSPTIILTPEGWNRIAELERQKAGKDSKQAFVAMWFDNNLDKAWDDGFKKAIEAAGYKPQRVDLKEHNEKICDTIIAEIRKSRFMVADFTEHRGGVYFEAGFAKGLGIEVIWTCREDEIDKSHFDTRQYNHIVWKNEKELYEKLRRRIEATISTI